jgi:hypothetical protein
MWVDQPSGWIILPQLRVLFSHEPLAAKNPCRAALGWDGRGARLHTHKNKSRQLFADG